MVAYAPGLPEGSQFGVNSGGKIYTAADRAAADDMRATLLANHPGLLSTRNLGWWPGDGLYHAEATLLLRAARQNGGSLGGSILEVHVDRSLCSSCRRVLPHIGTELGNPTVTFIGPAGSRRTMRDGAWID